MWSGRLRFARSHDLRIAPQGTGHGALPLGQLEGAMLLKTSRMRRVHISPALRSASAEAGAEWEDVVAPAGEHGLAALAGTSPNVGVTGYTLGGGMGWLARRYGLAANSVTAVELVTPDGRHLRADADDEPDLFWAVRGGGGSVGVVTALEMELYPVAELYAGALFFPIERSSEVLRAWREWTDTVPDEVTSMGRLLRLPPLPEVPEPPARRAFASVEAAYLGDAAAGAAAGSPAARARPRTRHVRDNLRPRAGATEHRPRATDPQRWRRRVVDRLPCRCRRHAGGAGRPGGRHPVAKHRHPAPRRRARA